MIRRLDAATDTFLTDLGNINRRLDRAHREITSGRKINRVSDSPDVLSNLLQLRTELQQTGQIRANLGRVKTEVDSAEQVLQSAVGLLERAATLGLQGANGVMDANQRGIISAEVEALLRQMVGLATTRVEARYIFAGDADGAAPYTVDFSTDDPVSAYQGAAATRAVQHPSGPLIAISKTAEEIFDNADPDLNSFDAINELRIALRDNDEAGIMAAVEKIRSVETHTNNMLASYGTAQNQIAEAMDFAYKQELRIKTRISEIQDADMTEAILALNEAQYQQKVALTAKSQIQRRSLFDYLA